MDRSDRSGYSYLADAIQRILANECAGRNAVTICFLNAPTGKHPLWIAGMLAVIESLWRQSFLSSSQSEYRFGKPVQAASHPTGPILVVGLGTALQLNPAMSHLQEDKSRILFHWPGIAYLPYCFTKDQLIAAARKVIEGAKEPLPPELLPTVEDVRRLTAEIRHWLENRRRNIEGALKNFEDAAHGETQLHHSYLEPVTAISEEHRAMLERLWVLEVPAAQFAPRIGGLAPLKAAVAEFEARWQVLEGARAALGTAGAEEQAGRLSSAVTEFRRVCEALSMAIAATRDLDKELNAQKGD